MSRGLVFDIQEFIKSEINMPNEYLFVLNSKVYACSDHILANFSSITQCFATKKIGIFRVKFIAFPSFPFDGPLSIFVSFLVPVNKRNS